jgi:hypothetical protein
MPTDPRAAVGVCGTSNPWTLPLKLGQSGVLLVRVTYLPPSWHGPLLLLVLEEISQHYRPILLVTGTTITLPGPPSESATPPLSPLCSGSAQFTITSAP